MEKIKLKPACLKINHAVGNLTKAFLNNAAKTVNRAFINYPLTDYFFRNIDFVKRVNLFHANYLLKSALSYGHAFYSGEDACAVLTGFHSEEFELTNWQMIKSGCLFLPIKIGFKTLSRIKDFNNYSSRIRRRNAPNPHFFVTTLAVDPAYQNKGYGKSLMNFLNRFLDNRKLSAYLETHTKRNVEYYKSFGYEVVEKNVIPGTILEHYSMLRPV